LAGTRKEITARVGSEMSPKGHVPKAWSSADGVIGKWWKQGGGAALLHHKLLIVVQPPLHHRPRNTGQVTTDSETVSQNKSFLLQVDFLQCLLTAMKSC
jgi:hypothetical protein